MLMYSKWVSCPNIYCNLGYIGSTSRNLKILICEHREDSFRTNRKLVNIGYSMIGKRSLIQDHRYGEVDSKILYRARNTLE